MVCWQILTDIAVVEIADSAFRAEKLVKQAVETLCSEIDELYASIEKSKGKVKTLTELVTRLQKQVQMESDDKAAEGETGENRSATKENQQLHFDLMEAQLNLEFAQADPVVSSKRIVVAKDTNKLLTLLSKAENAYKSSDREMCTKSQARLRSQVSL
jgi:hypothetical protein